MKHIFADVNRHSLATAAAIAILAVSPSYAQTAPGAAQGITIHVNTGRPLAEVLEGAQQHFRSPISFEEAPYESEQELSKVTILQAGLQKTLLTRPQVDFSVRLEAGDTTPFLAAQTALGAYIAEGLPGTYKVVQQNDRVDVVPVQVRSASGSMRDIQPIMSSPITFPLATRSALETVQLIVNGIASHTGAKILPLNMPFHTGETVELGAVGQSAADLIEELGAKLGGTLSFQCLYDPTDKAYYLNIESVAPLSPPGGQRATAPKTVPKTGSPNNPFFTKSK